jgi:spore coat protein U-like protein
LSYALFQDAARTINWGVTIGTDTLTGSGNGNAQALIVYGRVATGQLIAPGAYTDTVTATITY